MIPCKDGIHEYEEIAPKTYRIDEKGLVNAYLLLGEGKALLIDSGVGVGNILSSVQEITSLPITLALTHRHCDHGGGRNYFKECYIGRQDHNFACAFLTSKLACKVLLKANKSDLKLTKKPYHSHQIYIGDNHVFDLGDRKIRLLSVPGHTKGSFVYIDDVNHIMFTGDEVNPYLFMQLPGSTNLSTWLIGAKKILSLSKDHVAYGGHEKGLIKAEGISQIIKVVEEVLQKKPSFKGKMLDYPFDKTIFPRVIVKKANIR
mgnify:CR=1 FL=1